MNIPELKIFPLNNADVITASSGPSPVGSPMGYFLGSFFDGKSFGYEYFYSATGDNNGGTIKKLIGDKFDHGDGDGEFGALATFLGLDSSQASNLMDAKFYVGGELLYETSSGWNDFRLVDAVDDLENKGDSVGGGYSYFDDSEWQDVTISSLSDFFNTHLWQLKPYGEGYIFETNADEEYTITHNNFSEAGTYNRKIN